MREENADSFFRNYLENMSSVIFVEVGPQLGEILRDDSGASFVAGISRLRNNLSREWGVEMPSFFIKENTTLENNTYRFLLKNTELARNRAFPGKTLVISTEKELAEFSSRIDSDPIYHLPCVWMDPVESSRMKSTSAYMAPAEQVLLEHLEMILRSNISSFVTVEMVKDRLTHLNGISPGIVHSVLSKINLGNLVKVIRSLIMEGIPLTRLEQVIGAITGIEEEFIEDPHSVVEVLLKTFKDRLKNMVVGEKPLMFVTLDEGIQMWLFTHKKDNPLSPEDPVLGDVFKALAGVNIFIQLRGYRLAVLCGAHARPILRKTLEKNLPDVIVLSPEQINTSEEITIIRNIESKNPKLWLNRLWFRLTANRRSKKLVTESFDSYRKLIVGKKISLQPEIAEKTPGRESEFSPAIKEDALPLRMAPARELTIRQRIALNLPAVSPQKLRRILSELSLWDLTLLLQEVVRLPQDLFDSEQGKSEDMRYYFENTQDLPSVKTYLRNHFADPRDPLDMTALQKLAILISVLTPANAREIYTRFLKQNSHEDLRRMAVESADFKVKSPMEIRPALVEDFFWFYRGHFSLATSHSREKWTAELTNTALRKPDVLAESIVDLWLDENVLKTRLNKLVFRYPAISFSWINRYIMRNREMPINLHRMEKTIILLQSLPGEIAEGVIKNLGLRGDSILYNLPRPGKYSAEALGIVLSQILPHLHNLEHDYSRHAEFVN